MALWKPDDGPDFSIETPCCFGHFRSVSEQIGDPGRESGLEAGHYYKYVGPKMGLWRNVLLAIGYMFLRTSDGDRHLYDGHVGKLKHSLWRHAVA